MPRLRCAARSMCATGRPTSWAPPAPAPASAASPSSAPAASPTTCASGCCAATCRATSAATATGPAPAAAASRAPPSSASAWRWVGAQAGAGAGWGRGVLVRGVLCARCQVSGVRCCKASAQSPGCCACDATASTCQHLPAPAGGAFRSSSTGLTPPPAPAAAALPAWRCMQVFCCFGQSVASTRWGIQDEMHLQNTKCDNCIIGTMIAAQYLACLCWVSPPLHACVQLSCCGAAQLLRFRHRLWLSASAARDAACACACWHTIQAAPAASADSRNSPPPLTATSSLLPPPPCPPPALPADRGLHLGQRVAAGPGAADRHDCRPPVVLVSAPPA